METIFLSDVHLGLGTREEERAKEDRLLAFLDATRPTAEGLLILGDLFDLWFEYRTVIPKGFHRTLTALQRYTDAGIPVKLLTGNHDFWMGDFFETEIGVRILRDPTEIMVQGKRVYLHHGDGLGTNDPGYRFIKPILRSRLSITLYRWLHPDIGVSIARGSSRSSRAYTSARDFGEDQGMIAHATEKIREGVDVVVMGHRHVPALQAIGNGVYVNLGDWITHNSYGVMTGGTMTLHAWNGQQGSLHG
jgi:UDP-2,3-diacylglucosamine hydrolase